MKTRKVDPITGGLAFLKTLASENPYPDEQITTQLANITVDTALAKDTGYWETGILRERIEGKWVIVEQYADKAEAQSGHKKWVKQMTENPNCPLEDIDLWDLGVGNTRN